MKAQESYCIICGEKKDGIEIKEDHVIHAIRWFNRRILRQPPRNNRIVVCAKCYPKYSAQRKKYISRQWTYVILGVIFALFALFAAGDKLSALLLGLVIICLLYLFSLLSYAPALKYEPKSAAEEKKGGAKVETKA